MQSLIQRVSLLSQARNWVLEEKRTTTLSVLYL
jgi:hypothetical protein